MNEAITPPPALPATGSAASPADLPSLLVALPWAVLLLDAQGTVLYANPAAAAAWGLPLETLPGAVLATLPQLRPCQALHKLLAAATPAQCECFLPHSGQWLALSTTQLPQGLALFGQNITARRRMEAERQASHALLQGVLDAPNVNVIFSEAVRDEAAQLIDLRIVLHSQSAHTLYAGPAAPASLVGRSLLEALPHQSHLLATYQRVVGSGRTAMLELPYQQAGASKWLRLALARNGDGLVYVWEDITASKLAELEIRRGQELLQAIFNTTTDGIEVFRSVRNRQGEIIDFEWILNNQVSQNMLHRTDLAGKRWLEELPGMWSLGVFGRHRRVANLGEVADLEWQYQGEELYGWFHSVAVQFGDGLLLTWQDITERKRLQAETLRLQLSQQQQLAQAVLEAEENEKRRIAESLHNGLGQLLYATKLSLTQLDLGEPAAFAGAKQKASDLLSTSIAQARTLSHELMPQILEDFGLEVALQDICAKCSVSPLRLRYRVDDLPPRLSPHLALALYRMAQELANNIVKHAQATRASLQLLGQADGTIELRADDNGVGFVADPPGTGAERNGIGLQALHDRVRLLRGTLRVHTGPAQGTQIIIRLPWTAPKS